MVLGALPRPQPGRRPGVPAAVPVRRSRRSGAAQGEDAPSVAGGRSRAAEECVAVSGDPGSPCGLWPRPCASSLRRRNVPPRASRRSPRGPRLRSRARQAGALRRSRRPAARRHSSPFSTSRNCHAAGWRPWLSANGQRHGLQTASGISSSHSSQIPYSFSSIRIRASSMSWTFSRSRSPGVVRVPGPARTRPGHRCRRSARQAICFGAVFDVFFISRRVSSFICRRISLISFHFFFGFVAMYLRCLARGQIC